MWGRRYVPTPLYSDAPIFRHLYIATPRYSDVPIFRRPYILTKICTTQLNTPHHYTTEHFRVNVPFITVPSSKAAQARITYYRVLLLLCTAKQRAKQLKALDSTLYNAIQ